MRGEALDGGIPARKRAVSSALAVCARAEYAAAGIIELRQPQQLQLIAQRLETASPDSGSAEKIGVFFKAWARIDATSAFAGAIHLKSASLRTKALASVMETTCAAAARPLVASLSALPTEVLPMSQRGFLISTALVKWSEADPGAAAAYLESISPQGPDYYMAWSQIARRWALKDPPAALRWARSYGIAADGA